MKVVSYYTDNYKHVATSLIRSCQRLRIPYTIKRIKNKGSWEHNCNYKPVFLLQMLKTEPIVWVDADARVVRPIEGILESRGDICAYHLDNYIQTGTMLIRPTDNARRILRTWQQQCASNPLEWDQRNLDALGIEIGNLHPKWCWVYDRPKLALGGAEPHIVHYQASRKLKRPNRTFSHTVRPKKKA